MKKTMNGAALIITVWLIALATVLALNYSKAARSDTQITAAGLARLQARAAAEAGFWRAIYEIKSPLPEEPWPTDGTAIDFDFGDAQISVIAQDLAGLADLNSASHETLKIVIGYALQQPERAEQIVAAILDWRDRDNTALPFGAEDDDYRIAGLDYEAKDGPFNSREELQLVLGLTLDEYAAIAPFVTVHSQNTSVNLEVAPAYVARAMSELESPKISTATNELSNRIGQGGAARRTGRRGGGSFEILVEAHVKGVISRLAASVEINHSRRNNPGVAILSWREHWPFTVPKEDTDENPPAG